MTREQGKPLVESRGRDCLVRRDLRMERGGRDGASTGASSRRAARTRRSTSCASPWAPSRPSRRGIFRHDAGSQDLRRARGRLHLCHQAGRGDAAHVFGSWARARRLGSARRRALRRVRRRGRDLAPAARQPRHPQDFVYRIHARGRLLGRARGAHAQESHARARRARARRRLRGCRRRDSVPHAAALKYRNAGQICIAPTRFTCTRA